MTGRVTPWWEAMRLRREITAASGSINDVQMCLFRAVYGAAGEKPAYSKARYYGEITHPTPHLSELMAKVLVRLTGGERQTAVPALWRLDQAMGGGKSHGLIGLWHMAAHTKEMQTTDIGRDVFTTARRIAGKPLAEDVDAHVVVLACDHMTPGKGDSTFDGHAQTLHERFLWRLFSEDKALYRRYQPFYSDKNKLADALTAVDRPVLILIDEILDYVRGLSLSENADLAIKDMAFLRALLDIVNDVPNVAMVLVMIATEHDTIDLDRTGQQRRDEIDALLVRNGKTATVTSNNDFAAILRRRLFDGTPPNEVLDATAKLFVKAMKEGWGAKVFSSLPKATPGDFCQEVQRCYPFHPALIALAEQEWAPIAGFQKVRSTILIFAATAFALAARAKGGKWAPLLIGPGDLPLSVAEVREALINSGLISDPRTQANYRQLASTDVISDDEQNGTARLLDLKRKDSPFEQVNPRAAERAATALFVYSLMGPRGQGRTGAIENELKAASFVPHELYTVSDAETVLAELQDPSTGLAALERIEGRGGQPARLLLSTRQTLNMLFRAARSVVSDADRDLELAAAAGRSATLGRFKQVKFVEAQPEEEDRRTVREIFEQASLDDSRTTRLVVLDPRRFSFANGADADTRDAVRAAMGIGDQKLPVQWASSAVFAVINTQRRKNARGAVASYLAWKRVSELDSVKADQDLKEKAGQERAAAKRLMEDAIRLAYQYIVYLGQGESGEGRTEKEIRLDHENEASLDGGIVWAKLVDAGKAFGLGEFDAKALIHNLTDKDYGRPLDEIRDLFWSAPRMPLLPDGELDLQRAIYEAVSENQLRLVGGDGKERMVQKPSDIPVGSQALRLAKCVAARAPETRGGDRLPFPPQEPKRPTKEGEQEETRAGKPEVQLSLTLTAGLSDNDRRDAVWRVLNSLAGLIDDKHVSHIQLVVKAVMDETDAEELSKKAKDAGGASSSMPM